MTHSLQPAEVKRALEEAALNHDLKTIQYLIGLNIVDNFYIRTVLVNEVSLTTNSVALQWLLEWSQQCNPPVVSVDALVTAAENGRTECVRALLGYKPQPNNLILRAMERAAYWGEPNSLELLVNEVTQTGYVFSPTPQGQNLNTSLTKTMKNAIQRNNIKCVDIIFKHCTNIWADMDTFWNGEQLADNAAKSHFYACWDAQQAQQQRETLHQNLPSSNPTGVKRKI